MKLPTYFISHGSPDLLMRDAPASRFMHDMQLPLGQAKAILMISAHWETSIPAITATPTPETIHDFYGFPRDLYELSYPAAGDPTLAAKIQTLLKDAGIRAALDHERGLDHGAWMPLMLNAPAAPLPVVQLSIAHQHGSRFHYDIGRAIAPLREQGILIIGSGNLTHNVHEALRGDHEGIAPAAQAFDLWFDEKLNSADTDALIAWQQQAPHAHWNHPSDYHIMPFFVALGAAEGDTAERIHHSFDYDVLSMASYRFS